MLSPANKFRHFNVVVSVFLLILMIVIYSAWSINNSFKMAIVSGEHQAEGYTRAFSEHAETAFSESDRLLVDAIEAVQRKSFSFAELQRTFKNLAAGAPQVASMVLLDSRGALILDTLNDKPTRANFADRDYFSFHRDNLGGGLFISRPFKSRMTGKWRFSFSRPVLDKKGNFAGVVAVLFNIEYFRNFYSSINIGREGRVVLVHRNNPVLVMEPFTEKSMTLDYANSYLFREKLPKNSSGTFQVEKGIVVKSPARIISYRTLRDYPVIALVSFSRDEILVPWRSSAAKQAVSTVILCLVIIVLALLHIRQLRRLEETKDILVSQQKELKSGEEQRRHVEAQLLQSQKMESVGQLAGGVAHDFNNLLTPIIGYAELLRAAPQFEVEDRAKLDGILGAATRAKELTTQLLGFARKQIMSMSVIDLNSSIMTFHTILRRVIKESIDISMQLDPVPVFICADKSQLEHVILNLAVNAQDAITGHGVISLTTSRIYLNEKGDYPVPDVPPGRYVVLTVADTGSGIDGRDMDHIFEPFYTTKPAGHGTGLGLAMVYGIIKQHNGFISVRSSPGSGSAFNLYLPEVDGDAQCTIPAEIPVRAQPSDSARVLVVEDNEMVRDMVVHILTSEGHKVTAAETAEHALSLVALADTPFDLLISDVIMPGMNGPDMYLRMRDEVPNIKALFISGYSNDPVLMSAIDSESVSFLQKPFSIDDLIARVTESLNSHRR